MSSGRSCSVRLSATILVVRPLRLLGHVALWTLLTKISALINSPLRRFLPWLSHIGEESTVWILSFSSSFSAEHLTRSRTRMTPWSSCIASPEPCPLAAHLSSRTSDAGRLTRHSANIFKADRRMSSRTHCGYGSLTLASGGVQSDEGTGPLFRAHHSDFRTYGTTTAPESRFSSLTCFMPKCVAGLVVCQYPVFWGSLAEQNTGGRPTASPRSTIPGPIHWRSPVACSPSEGTDATTLQRFHTRRRWASHVPSQRFCSPTDQKTKTPASENDPAGCKLAFSNKRVARLHFSSLRERGGRARWRRSTAFSPCIGGSAKMSPQSHR